MCRFYWNSLYRNYWKIRVMNPPRTKTWIGLTFLNGQGCVGINLEFFSASPDFQARFLYGNCQILIINSHWGLNSNTAVTEVTSPWLIHSGEDKYDCHLFQIIKIPHLLSMTPQGYPVTKTNVCLYHVIQKATGHHFAETRFLVFHWQLLWFHCDFTLRPREIVHHLQMEISNYFCLCDNCCTLIIYFPWDETKWPPFFQKMFRALCKCIFLVWILLHFD